MSTGLIPVAEALGRVLASIPAPVEAETVVDDAQALERRLTLKLRDGGFEDLILVVADTPRNRRALAGAPAALGRFDVPARSALLALRNGDWPEGSCLVLL